MNCLSCIFSKWSRSQFMEVTRLLTQEQLIDLFRSIRDHQATCRDVDCVLERGNSYIRRFFQLIVLTHYEIACPAVESPKEQAVFAVSAVEKVFYMILRTSKVFNMINFSILLKRFFLNSLQFNSSLISH